MTTDQMILALVQRHGFKLPVCLQFWPTGRPGLFARAAWTVAGLLLDQAYAHDLCAMEFARQACRGGTWSYELSAALCAGDSAAAIKALYEAMESR